jgi:ribosomal protein S27AE
MPVRISHRDGPAKKIIELLGRGMYQADIARELGVSRQYVSQVATPIKVYARGVLHTAIDNGSVKVPEVCSQCGKAVKLHGHHPDYLEPLEVVWLCARCHSAAHWGKASKAKTPKAEGVANPMSSEIGRALANLRWSKATAEDRRKFGQMMNAARWGKKEAAK